MVVYGSDINEYEAKLKFLRPKSNIAKGKDELFKEELGWLVSYSLDAKLEVRSQYLIQAGMINFWTKYLRFLRRIKFNGLNRSVIKNNDDPKSLKI